MARLISLSRDEAEMLVDICENSTDGRLHILAAELRKLFGMDKSDGKPGSIEHLGLHPTPEKPHG